MGAFAWNNVVIQGNAWTFPGTPPYGFVTTSGGGWNLVSLYNLTWMGDSCSGCTHSDVNHGVVELTQTTTIEPYGPVVYAIDNASSVTATVDARKEQNGAQIQIVNAGTQAINFVSDANMSLSAPVTLPGGANSSITFLYNAGLGKFTLPAGSGSISASAGTPQSATVNTAFATALQVTVTSGGSPVNGATVTFTAPTTGASGIFSTGGATATAITNTSGVATAPALTANSQAGGYSVHRRRRRSDNHRYLQSDQHGCVNRRRIPGGQRDQCNNSCELDHRGNC